MDLNRLRYFIAVSEELHFSRAALRLHVAQPALSHAIRLLERDLGVVLFDRSTRRVELTEAGAALLPEARRLILAADRLQQVAAEQRSARRQTLRVGLFYGTMAALELTQPILNTFRYRHPNVRLRFVELDVTNQVVALRNHRVDVAVVRLPLGADDVHVTELFAEPRVAMLPPEDKLADQPYATPDQLYGRTWFPQGHQPSAFDAYYKLGDIWDVAELRRASDPVTNPWEMIEGIHRGTTAVTGLSLVRRYVHEGLTVLPLDGVAGSPIGVARRADDDCPTVSAFTTVARQVTEELHHLVPQAQLLPGPSST